MEITENNDKQIGILIGQQNIMIQSLASLHDKVEAFNQRCDPCKKDIEAKAEKIAMTVANDKMNTIKQWIMGGVITVSVVFIGYLVVNHFLPDVINKPVEQQKYLMERAEHGNNNK